MALKTALLYVFRNPVEYNIEKGWEFPNTIYLVARQDGKRVEVFEEYKNEVSLEKCGFSDEGSARYQHQPSVFCLQSGSTQYGVLSVEITPEEVDMVYLISIQMANALMAYHTEKKRLSVQRERELLLEELRSKNEILKATNCTVAVKNANLTIKEGEFFVIMGLSGSGKSTLLRCINRLIKPTKGQVLINGTDITAASDKELLEMRRREIAMVFQNFGLLPHRSVLSNIAFGLELQGVPKQEREEKSHEEYGNSRTERISESDGRTTFRRNAATCGIGTRFGK